MSSDLYTSEINSERYGDLFLEMKASGNLIITTQDPATKKQDDRLSSYFMIPPTPEGWKEAENLIGALQEWVKHTKELEEQRIWVESLTLGSDR